MLGPTGSGANAAARRCGLGGVGAQLRRRGIAAASLDIQIGARGNFMSEVLEGVLKGWFSSGAVLEVWLGALAQRGRKL